MTAGNISRHIVAICTRNPARTTECNDVGETRALLFIRYLFANARATEGLPGPAGDRFEKLLIVLFWKGVPLSPSSSPSFSLEMAPFHASCWLTRRRRIGRERAPFSIGTRGFLSRRCESMGGDRSQKVEPILL